MRGTGVSLRYVLVPGGASVVITDQAIRTMKRFRQTGSMQKEAGGQLFGHFDGLRTIVVEATPPKLLDRRGRAIFRPNRWLQHREIRDRYARGLHFIGDWHTHPEKIPHPSNADLHNMAECFERSVHELHAFVMIIVGTALPPEGLHVSLIKKDDVLIMAPDMGT